VELVYGFADKLSDVMAGEWDMIYLNGTTHSKLPYNDKLFKVRKLSGAFGYLVNERYYDKLIEVLSQDKKPVDGYYMDLQPYSDCYLTKEKLVRHLDGYSVRTEKIVVYPHLR